MLFCCCPENLKSAHSGEHDFPRLSEYSGSQPRFAGHVGSLDTSLPCLSLPICQRGCRASSRVAI